MATSMKSKITTKVVVALLRRLVHALDEASQTQHDLIEILSATVQVLGQVRDSLDRIEELIEEQTEHTAELVEVVSDDSAR